MYIIQVGTILNAKENYEGTFNLSELTSWTIPVTIYDNFPFNQNSLVISVKSWKVCSRDMVFQQKLLENADFIFKVTDRAMVWLASSDKWKGPW